MKSVNSIREMLEDAVNRKVQVDEKITEIAKDEISRLQSEVL